MSWRCLSACCVALFLLPGTLASAWSNRGHRLVNLAAAQSLPAAVPAFLRTPAAAEEIAYLGPEPDRWRPDTEAELSPASSPDHDFFLEPAAPLFPLPRSRYDYFSKVDEYRLTHPAAGPDFTAAKIGTLPWQVIEIYERLTAAFRAYRVLTGQLPQSTLKEIEPMTAADLPQVEQSILFYAGWLGHYAGDAAQPLHTTTSTDGWKPKQNARGFRTRPGIHGEFEALADDAIASGALNAAMVEKQMPAARALADPFADTIAFLQDSKKRVPELYELEKSGQFRTGSAPLIHFEATCMAAGSSFLRDLIYTAWLRSASTQPDAAPAR